jgi:hypothetical protein
MAMERERERDNKKKEERAFGVEGGKKEVKKYFESQTVQLRSDRLLPFA